MKQRAIPKSSPQGKPAGPRRVLQIGWAAPTQFKVPVPKNEKGRLAALRKFEILDTPAEESFDAITRLAAQVCHMPMAMISLVDSDRQWFKSKVGISVTETPRAMAFCAHAIMKDQLLVVEDALADERFMTNPLVTSSPRIRFYAGAPLMAHGNYALGTLCVIDSVPRALTREQEAALRALSRLVMELLELRREVSQFRKQLLEQRLTERNLKKLVRRAQGASHASGAHLDKLEHEAHLTAQAAVNAAQAMSKGDLTVSQKECLGKLNSAAAHLAKVAEEIRNLPRVR